MLSRDLTNPISTNKPVIILGFDFGVKYIGIAVGQTATNTARPLTCLKVKNKQINWGEIDQLIKDWNPGQLIVGISTDMYGKIQHTTLATLKFFNLIKQRYNIPVYKVNECLSTWEAKKKLLVSQNTRYTSKELLAINAMAAAILVQEWLNEHQ